MTIEDNPRHAGHPLDAGKAPLLSIVIPTYARPGPLEACLRGIAGQASPEPFEVIVVDDGGEEPMDSVVGLFSGLLDLRLTRTEHGGPGAARNAGVALARGAFVAFIDDDCVPGPGWMAALLTMLGRHPNAIVGGHVRNALAENPYADASDRVWQFVSDYHRTAVARERFFTTNNIALATDRFRSLGGFTTAIPSRTAEDKEFCDRWLAAGGTLQFAPGAVVLHAHDLTLGRFLRQHFGYGRGILAFRLLRRRRRESRLVPEPMRFYLGLITSPIRERRPGRWRALLLIAAAQAATIAGAAYEALAWRHPGDAGGSVGA
jgi:GT2 family glycosyltransferase